MKKNLSVILGAVQSLAALCALGAIKIWAPTCAAMVTLENGNTLPMKCHYAGQAGAALAVVLLAAGIVAMLSKKDHKKVQFVLISGAVMLFLVFSSLIGVCMKAEMACHVTAAWCKGISVVILVCAVIDLITGKEGQLPV